MKKQGHWKIDTAEEAVRALRELPVVAMGSQETLVKVSSEAFGELVEKTAMQLRRRRDLIRGRQSQRLIERLRDLADIGVVNAKQDSETLREAADMLEAMDERLAIMEESCLGPDGKIRPGANIDLLALLPKEGGET